MLIGIGEDGTVNCVNADDGIRKYLNNMQDIREIDICEWRWIICKHTDGTIRVLPLQMNNDALIRVDESDPLGVMQC